jgi:uncharacterized protein
MRILQKIWLVLLLGTISSVYGEDCYVKPYKNCFSDADACRVLAEQGHACAQYHLGWKYHNGKGVIQDYKEALKWYSKAAEQGHISSQYNVADIYLNGGEGIFQDYKEAERRYRLIADKAPEKNLGSSSIWEIVYAQNTLGWMYSHGKGVIQDYKEAVKWFSLAAERGYYIAQVNLGMMYENGEGIVPNYAMAHMYYNIAATSGYEDAVENRKRISKKMQLSQIEEAQDLAREWVRGHDNNLPDFNAITW